jgi:2-oxoisovalerate dehydrogenase E1 component beta subunit
VPIGKAALRREGDDLSIITYGAMVYKALEAADELAKDGIEVEVLDLRTILPLDEEAILATAKKTSKVIVMHEATMTGGPGGEVVARIAQKAFEYLDGPIVRIAPPDTPVPYSPPLEEAFLPQVKDIVATARKLAAY